MELSAEEQRKFEAWIKEHNEEGDRIVERGGYEAYGEWSKEQEAEWRQLQAAAWKQCEHWTKALKRTRRSCKIFPAWTLAALAGFVFGWWWAFPAAIFGYTTIGPWWAERQDDTKFDRETLEEFAEEWRAACARVSFFDRAKL